MKGRMCLSDERQEVMDKQATQQKRPKRGKAGFSLIEIMVATLVLAVLAVGGAAALYHTGAMIQNQEQKRMAVDQAMERLELLKRAKYSLLKPADFNSTKYFVDDQNDIIQAGELLDTMTVESGKQFAMLTAIERLPPPNALSSEYLRLNVTVTYDNAGQEVKLDTRIIPDL
jgi:prepilin-type N-terminal cleavage/methylation domain-containing protein